MRLLVESLQTLELLNPGLSFMFFAILPSPWKMVCFD